MARQVVEGKFHSHLYGRASDTALATAHLTPKLTRKSGTADRAIIYSIATGLALLSQGDPAFAQNSVAALPPIAGAPAPGPDTDSQGAALDISGDGSVVVGQSITGDLANGTLPIYRAFRWDAAAGTSDLGTLNDTAGTSSAYAVSGDGRVIAGESTYDPANSFRPQAFRWTAGDGMVGLGTITTSPGDSRAFGVSGDGSVIVGESQTDIAFGGISRVRHAFRWTEAEGMQDLGSLTGPEGGPSRATDVSGDGNVIVGYARNDAGNDQAFRWTEADGMVGLIQAGVTGQRETRARGISRDGRVIVGTIQNLAFRWTEADDIVVLNTAPDFRQGLPLDLVANATDADGDIIVGYAQSLVSGEGLQSVDGPEKLATYWTEQFNIRSLNDLLSDTGLDMTGIVLTEATGISDNGQFIVGQGSFIENGSEVMRPFVARYARTYQLTPVPADPVSITRIPILAQPVELFGSGGGSSSANGVSGDGTRVVGSATSAQTYQFSPSSQPSNQTHAYLRRADGSMVDIGTMDGSVNTSSAAAISGDGRYVVGASTVGDRSVSTSIRAYRWSENDGFTDLGLLPGGEDRAEATAVNSDGTVIVGQALSEIPGLSFQNLTAFRWTETGGMERLGLLQGGRFSLSTGVSGDGSIVVGLAGYHDDVRFQSGAFRWTQADGMVALPTDPSLNQAAASGISRDGSTIIGGSEIFGWRYTEAEGMQFLNYDANLAEVLQTVAPAAVNADGSVIVGSLNGYTDNLVTDPNQTAGDILGQAFRWDATSGTRRLADLLTEAGVDMGNIYLFSANGVSDNGEFIVGDADFDTADNGDGLRGYIVRYIAPDGAPPAEGETLTDEATPPPLAIAGGAGPNPVYMTPAAPVDDAALPTPENSEVLLADIGGLAGTVDLRGRGVANAGAAVVGYGTIDDGNNDRDYAFRWTPSGGLADLGTIGGANGSARAEGVSDDGAIVVGRSVAPAMDGATGNPVRAFRWTQGTGMQDLGTIDDFAGTSEARGISGDGNVIVGHSDTADGIRPFRWTAAGGMENLGLLPDASASRFQTSTANAADADGDVVVGSSATNIAAPGNTTFNHAFRWTQAGGMRDLGTIGNVAGNSVANDVNADGTVVVGQSAIISTQTRGGAAAFSPLFHSFRWTEETGMVPLGNIEGYEHRFSRALAVSGDGNVIVGFESTEPNGATFQDVGEGARAYRWTPETGTQDLVKLLDRAGVDMTGVALYVASDVSSDGQFITGHGARSGTNGAAPTSLALVVRYLQTGPTPPPPPTPAPPPPPTPAPPPPPTPAPPPPPTPAPPPPPTPAPPPPPTPAPPPPPTPAPPPPPTPAPPPPPTPAPPPPPTPAPPPPPPIGGVTTPQSVMASAYQLSAGRTRVMTQHHGFASAALDKHDPMGTDSRFRMYASTGSSSFGVSMRLELTEGFALIGAAFGTDAKYQGSRPVYADLDRSVTYAGAIRWAGKEDWTIRPFVEAGGWLMPDADLRFQRYYANGAGVAVGNSRHDGRLDYLYGRAGAGTTLGSDIDVALFAEIGRETLNTDGFVETLSAANPFEATHSASKDRMTVGTLGLNVDFSPGNWLIGVRGAWSKALDYDSDLSIAVPGIGTLSPLDPDKFDWIEYGAQLGYRFTPGLSVSVYVSGIESGDVYVGSETHFGVQTSFAF